MLAKKFALCLIVGIASCSHPEATKPADNPYFLLETGRYSDFRVDKTTFEIGKTDQLHSLKYRRKIGEAFKKSDGGQAFAIGYSSLKLTNRQTDSVSAIWQTENRIFELENGQPVIKLTLPAYEGAIWNVNAYNARTESISRITETGKSYQIGNQVFENTITVIRQDDSTLLTRKKYIEIYAQNVGLIRRERLNLQYCHKADCLGKGIVLSGSKEITTIENFGKQ
ncbi:hypothetical protein [Dyadobacter luticola]|uniref:Lipoprotein n=1 Tax=Dyadobacter luticola TaxID=1979387 RepID=A0A5R9KXV4_9BACT|nr:hypothetical protein [Dyadobacter luticola]TLV01142.1 hypothetical protein FEN17_16970 [Dyadobacter luticola]